MTTPSGDVPFAIDGNTLSSVETASDSVGGPFSVETILLIVGLAVLTVGVLGILAYLYSAQETVDREIREVEAERSAFYEFADRIESMPVDRQATAMATPQAIQTFDSSGPPVYDVAAAFEETVMSLPHYQETYGEDVMAQLATEMDPDLVASLKGQPAMSETIKDGLRRGATDAARRRAELLSELETERDVLSAAEGEYGSIRAELRELNRRPLGSIKYSSLQDHHRQLGTLKNRVRRALADRQHAIQNDLREVDGYRDPVTLQEYLYGGEGPTYPVLATGVEFDRLIDRARERVRRAIWSRA